MKNVVLEWQKKYFVILSNYANNANVDFSLEKLSDLQCKLIFHLIFKDFQEGKLSLDDFSMLSEVLSQKSSPSGNVYWELLLAAELEWYEKNDPSKLDSFISSINEYLSA
jgi:esterase/lipase superfamily enzyme